MILRRIAGAIRAQSGEAIKTKRSSLVNKGNSFMIARTARGNISAKDFMLVTVLYTDRLYD